MKKLKNKVVYIKDEKMLEEAKKIIEGAGYEVDYLFKERFENGACYLNRSIVYEKRFYLKYYSYGSKQISFNRFKWILRPTWLNILVLITASVTIYLLILYFWIISVEFLKYEL